MSYPTVSISYVSYGKIFFSFFFSPEGRDEKTLRFYDILANIIICRFLFVAVFSVPC